MKRILLLLATACIISTVYTGCADLTLLQEDQDVHLQPVGE